MEQEDNDEGEGRRHSVVTNRVGALERRPGRGATFLAGFFCANNLQSRARSSQPLPARHSHSGGALLPAEDAGPGGGGGQEAAEAGTAGGCLSRRGQGNGF